MHTPDPLEPRIYPAEVPFVAPLRPAAGSGSVPWLLRMPGAAVPWGLACLVAFAFAAFACLIATVDLLIGGPRVNIGYLLVGIPWMRVHLGQPRRRWWALAAALPFFVAATAVGGYLQAPLFVVLVFAYTAVTHIPTRDGSRPRTDRSTSH